MNALLRRLRALAATTPGRYRLWSTGIALTLVAMAVVATVAATSLRSGTNRIRNNSGPVLVTTQQLVASLAEADAAASAAFLSGRQEDPEQRRLYEEALNRASQQMEDVSSLIGEDPASHRSLKSLSSQVTRYAGLVEAARAINRAGQSGGETYLVDALNLLGSAVANEAGQLTRATQQRFGRDENRRDSGVLLAIALGVLALAVLLAGQRVVTRLSRRLLNPPLVLATLALAVSTGWLAVANLRSGNDLSRAREKGFESIALTARIQATGFRAKADQTVHVITGDRVRLSIAQQAAADLAPARVSEDVLQQARLGALPPGAGLLNAAAVKADSPRERAAAAEMLVRWQRYADTVADLNATGDAARRRAIAVGPSSAAFNGFNFSVESVLGDNRAQFLGGLEDASRRLRGLTAVTVLVPLGAAAAAVAGFRLRINEYR